MSHLIESRAVETSLKIYRRLLAAYPSEHRQEYGGSMEQLFRDQCRDAWNEDRGWGLAKLWLRVIPDLLRTSILEHLTQFNRKKIMPHLFNARSTPISIFITAFSAVFLLVFGSSLLITFMLPQLYSSTTRIRVEPGAMGIVTNAQGYVEPGYDPYFIQTEFRVIQSEVVLGPVIDKLRLQELWGQRYRNGHKLNRNDALQKLNDSMNLRPVRNSSIIEIGVYAQAPGEAAQIAQEVAESYKHYNQLRRITITNSSPVVGRVDIIDPALPNPRPVAPKRTLNIALGTFFGVIFGSVAGAASAGVVSIRRRRLGDLSSQVPSRATS